MKTLLLLIGTTLPLFVNATENALADAFSGEENLYFHVVLEWAQ